MLWVGWLQSHLPFSCCSFVLHIGTFTCCVFLALRVGSCCFIIALNYIIHCWFLGNCLRAVGSLLSVVHLLFQAFLFITGGEGEVWPLRREGVIPVHERETGEDVWGRVAARSERRRDWRKRGGV